MSKVNDMHTIIEALLEYIDAIPSDVAAKFPTMPGISRDWVEEVLSSDEEDGMTEKQLADTKREAEHRMIDKHEGVENAIRVLTENFDADLLLSRIRQGTTAEELLETERDALRARVAELEKALPDPDKLEILARWFDMKYPSDDNPEVQTDLREWAKKIRRALEEK